ATRKGIEQVIRSQRLPVREARTLRRALVHPREVEQISPALHSDALRRFILTQVLLAALVDGRLEAAELAFVERLARAVGVAAAGGTHSGEQRANMPEHVIDLAIATPPPAISAAPGRMLLQPLPSKLRPFNLLPSSFTDPPPVPALPEPRRRSG